MRSHLKRLNAPKSWKIQRKATKFLTRPHPGGQPIDRGLPLAVILRDYLNYAKNMSEVRKILGSKHVLVDNKRRTDPKFHVGLMDVITIQDTKEHFRMLLDRSGRLSLVKTPEKEAMHKPKRIDNITKLRKGVIQVNFFDGHNILLKENVYKPGDTVLTEFPGRIVEHLKLEPSALVYLIGGKHRGDTGTLEKKDEMGFWIKSKSGKYLARKKHVFVIGKKQPCITLGS